MAIDKTELATELEKNPEILTAVVDGLTKKGYSVYDKVKHTEFIDNLKKDVIEKEMKTEIEKVHSKYDEDIKSLFGIDKKDRSEKSYEYLKRAAGESTSASKAKIVELERVISEKGDPTGSLQKKITDLEEKARLAIEDRDTQIKTLKGDNDKATRGLHMQTLYGELSKTFIKTLPPMFAELSKMVLNEASGLAVVKDGKIYLGDGTGAIKKDASFKEILMEEHLKEKFKDVIDVPRKAGGAGSGNGEGKDHKIDPSTLNKTTFEVPVTVKKQGDLMDVMLERGLVRGTPQFNEIWNKFARGIEMVKDGNKMTEKKVGEGLPM